MGSLKKSRSDDYTHIFSNSAELHALYQLPLCPQVQPLYATPQASNITYTSSCSNTNFGHQGTDWSNFDKSTTLHETILPRPLHPTSVATEVNPLFSNDSNTRLPSFQTILSAANLKSVSTVTPTYGVEMGDANLECFGLGF